MTDCGWGGASAFSLSPLFLPCLSVFPVITGSRCSPVSPGTLWTRAQAELCVEAALASVTAFLNRPAGVVRAGPRQSARLALLESPSPSSSVGSLTSRIKPLCRAKLVPWSGELACFPSSSGPWTGAAQGLPPGWSSLVKARSRGADVHHLGVGVGCKTGFLAQWRFRYYSQQVRTT